MGQNTLWFVDWLSTKWDRVLVWLTESTIKGPGEKRKLEKSTVQMIPGQEGASNSVSSPVAMCLGHWLLEKEEDRVQSVQVTQGQ